MFYYKNKSDKKKRILAGAVAVKHPPFSFLFLFMRPDSYYT